MASGRGSGWWGEWGEVRKVGVCGKWEGSGPGPNPGTG